MVKVAIVYWSGTGNTQAMAHAIKDGVERSGNAVEIFEVDQFRVDDFKDYQGYIFGCPAMGAEVLEEGSFEPFFTAAESHLKDKPVALFGSYGWGGGEWMRTWAERTRMDGAKLYNDGLIVENGPTDDDLKNCVKLGEEFARSIEA